mmetsp:Transcript_16993/g.60399  ORF Transcript_16993/g.60399 Transcript_16993/m.60399 type:complete len:219 (-) Transcript_16993:530-1186(-)
MDALLDLTGTPASPKSCRRPSICCEIWLDRNCSRMLRSRRRCDCVAGSALPPGDVASVAPSSQSDASQVVSMAPHGALTVRSTGGGGGGGRRWSESIELCMPRPLRPPRGSKHWCCCAQGGAALTGTPSAENGGMGRLSKLLRRVPRTRAHCTAAWSGDGESNGWVNGCVCGCCGCSGCRGCCVSCGCGGICGASHCGRATAASGEGVTSRPSAPAAP